jgi:transketolase
VDGNNVAAILGAIDRAKTVSGKPHAVVLDTLMGKGVRAFELREKNHFIRVDADEWRMLREQLEVAAPPPSERI